MVESQNDTKAVSHHADVKLLADCRFGDARTTMNKAEASELIAKLVECQHALDKALEFAEKLPNGDERRTLTETLKDAVAEILTEAIMPVVSQHPELNPYE